MTHLLHVRLKEGIYGRKFQRHTFTVLGGGANFYRHVVGVAVQGFAFGADQLTVTVRRVKMVISTDGKIACQRFIA